MHSAYYPMCAIKKPLPVYDTQAVANLEQVLFVDEVQKLGFLPAPGYANGFCLRLLQPLCCLWDLARSYDCHPRAERRSRALASGARDRRASRGLEAKRLADDLAFRIYGFAAAQSSFEAILAYAPKHDAALYNLASLAAMRDGIAQVVHWLAQAIEQQPSWRAKARTDPVFDRIRSDPRFQALVAGGEGDQRER